MLFNINVKLISPAYRLIIMLIAFGFSFTLSSQTVLSAGDILVIGFKTNATTDAGNDAFKLVTLVDLQCNTKFIVTDNNWNNSIPGWACNDDEFAVEITCSTIISAGSVFYIDASASLIVTSTFGMLFVAGSVMVGFCWSMTCVRKLLRFTLRASGYALS